MESPHRPPFATPDLSGQVALITGASRGIGRNIALSLAKAGADIVVAAKSERGRDLLPGSIHETAQDVEALGRKALAVRTDVRSLEDLEHLAAAAEEHFGGVDILVNNAGALWWKPVVDTPAKRFDLMMEVNVRAAFLLSNLLVPGMIQRDRGLVVQMSPPLDRSMMRGKTGYCISKFGMSLLAMGLGDELAKTSVRSCALWPATAIESQATINHGLGGPKDWRKADILADALLAILSLPSEKTQGRCLIDEELLEEMGVDDLTRYLCVEDGRPMRIVGKDGVQSGLWQG